MWVIILSHYQQPDEVTQMKQATRFEFEGSTYWIGFRSAYQGMSNYDLTARGGDARVIREERREFWSGLDRKAVAEYKRASRNDLRASVRKMDIDYSVAMRYLKGC
jgi:hypothetical protein